MINNGAVRLAAKLLGSSVLAQLAVLGATALAAREVTPHDMSAYGVVYAAAVLVATFNTWAAEARMAVVEEGPAASLARAGLTATLAFAGVILLGSIVLLVSGHTVKGICGLLIAVASLMTGWTQLLTGIVLRDQRQTLLARYRLVQGVTNAVLILVLLVSAAAGYLVLSLSWALSLVVGNVVLIAGMRGRLPRYHLPGRDEWRLLFRELRWQPFSNALLNAAGSLPLLVLPAVGAAQLSGAWALANRFLMPIVSTLNTTLQPIYYGKAAELRRTHDVSGLRDYHAMWVKRFALTALPLAVAFGFGVWVLIPLLGPQWSIARLVVVPAVVYYTVLYAFIPLSQTLVLLGRVDVQMRWTIAFAVMCGLPFLLSPLIGGGPALVWWALGGAIVFLGQIVLHRRVMRDLA
ncbi:lipopolysaccharide biosynthesis protein [Actinomycetota bacterium]